MIVRIIKQIIYFFKPTTIN